MENKVYEKFKGAMEEIAKIGFKKDALNNGKGNKYITLDNINNRVVPILIKHSLHFIVYRDNTQNAWGKLLCLEDGSEINVCFGFIDFNPIVKGKDGSEKALMNDAQAQGALFSYIRRYVTTLFFNLLTDADTDAEVVSKEPVKTKAELEAEAFQLRKITDKERVEKLMQDKILNAEQGLFWINTFSMCTDKQTLLTKEQELAKLLKPISAPEAEKAFDSGLGD